MVECLVALSLLSGIIAFYGESIATYHRFMEADKAHYQRLKTIREIRLALASLDKEQLLSAKTASELATLFGEEISIVCQDRSQKIVLCQYQIEDYEDSMALAF